MQWLKKMIGLKDSKDCCQVKIKEVKENDLGKDSQGDLVKKTNS
ncbi:hypothetical protein SAMN05216353_12834 [Halobacillus alkaliphilus]|uniref:Uncharacterized protein n=1 Tax=Halobacillus alkaliphilus TaxID=396056 RepID=A0A1I2Q2R9_9BACI|nr:hypothetical protein [Halobacillus alkaliphilus]SFG21659.1 hypothetical protein SAMN05216353_12834 [Halobacillus alkaliphilus]